MPSDPDLRIVLLAISGDMAAFESLVRAHQNYVVGLLRRSCGDAALVEDVAQQTFIKAWARIITLRDPRAFRGWLRRIAMNTLVDAIRRHRIITEEFSAEVLAADQISSAPDLIEKMDIDAALVNLSFNQRTCILLGYGEGMSHAEISEVLDMPLGTVKSHITRGLDNLRLILNVKDQSHDRV